MGDMSTSFSYCTTLALNNRRMLDQLMKCCNHDKQSSTVHYSDPYDELHHNRANQMVQMIEYSWRGACDEKNDGRIQFLLVFQFLLKLNLGIFNMLTGGLMNETYVKMDSTNASTIFVAVPMKR